MPATHDDHPTIGARPALYLALDLGWASWQLAFADSPARPPRRVAIPARDLDALRREVDRARRRFELPDDAPVRSCYEAGRDGFWPHRALVADGVDNVVVDSSSIEVDRRARSAKSDGIDAEKLLRKLIRYHAGERRTWSVVNVPTPADEDRRQPHRDRDQLVRERTEHTNRIKGLLAFIGLDVVVDHRLMVRVDALRQWDDSPVPPELRARIAREFERWKLADAQLNDLANRQRRDVRDDSAGHVSIVRTLLNLRGVGPVSAWTLAGELFGWRRIRNRRQLAGLVGLTPTPYRSGASDREQGISKAGNRRVRYVMIELAWGWLKYQPDSALSAWYNSRFGEGNGRSRKSGIVALARKLLVALWKLVDRGEMPEGASTVPWEEKLNGRMPAGLSPG